MRIQARAGSRYSLKNLCLLTLTCLLLISSFSSLAFGASYPVLPTASQSPKTAQIGAITPAAVKSYVRAQAALLGVNPDFADFIVGHESQYGQNMSGDDGQSRGYWMISKIYHPEVSDACADDLACSTSWSLRWILAGHINQWSTWRFRCEWYKNALDCP
jgi:hypothetical protein